jgi:hypothetical protein
MNWKHKSLVKIDITKFHLQITISIRPCIKYNEWNKQKIHVKIDIAKLQSQITIGVQSRT